MIDFEMKMAEIKERNEANMQKQAEREARHRAQVEARKQEREEKKAADELLRK